ncbi:hypothetical protein OAM76_06560 [Flavobacteriaceae bacterium]|nr:hypothetical protein [Flavobacteriaceae bacterium]MDC1459416.1 hypothetical protein [Flavobacteriaceae bacterium]
MKRFLYIFFFGYSRHKWRRIIRTFLTLILLSFNFAIVVSVLDRSPRYHGVIENLITPLLSLSSSLFIVMLISWLIAPFFITYKDK